jgi:hypothetical protein
MKVLSDSSRLVAIDLKTKSYNDFFLGGEAMPFLILPKSNNKKQGILY